MMHNARTLAILGAVGVAACAQQPQDGFTGTEFMPTGAGSGSTSSSGDDAGPVQGVINPPPTPTDATIGFITTTTEDAGDAGSAQEAAANAPVSCVTTRTCTTCDELTVSGDMTAADGSHAYIEPAPDDGSRVPLPAEITPFASGMPATTGGPCITEPGAGALFPNNWVRVRFNYGLGSTTTIFQIRIHAARQAHDFVAYTRSPTWELPKSIWTSLDQTTMAMASSNVTFQIAPANSNGSMVYWAAVGLNAGQAWLESFSPGDENVAQALVVPQVQWNISRNLQGTLQTGGAGPGDTQCIGCHVAVPDHQSVLFLDTYPWDGVAAIVDPDAGPGNMPSWLTPGGAELLSLPWKGMMAFSPTQWDLGNHIAIAASQNPPGATWFGMNYQGSPASLVWIDLSTQEAPVLGGNANATPTAGQIGMLPSGGAAGYGTITRTGDDNSALAPAWSHDGNTIVYVSNNAPQDGRLGQAQGGTVADLYSVPYNNKAGGNATPITGASDPNYLEYYPSFSPDDQFVAFNRAPGADNPYYDPNAEVNVIQTTGGTPLRLKANDPPACSQAKSPGVTNSWAKFAPDGPTCGGSTYYWLIFSSSRLGIPFANLA